MLRINRDLKRLVPLSAPTMQEASLLERQDLQEWIVNSPEAFFAELGEELFLIGQEIRPSEVVQDRIDLVAIDREGRSVIIELKRGSHKLQHLQAIAYAGMVSKWSVDELLGFLDEAAAERLDDFLEVDRDVLNRAQRVILIAEAFDYALLVACEWLNENHGVELECYTLSMATDPEAGAEYLAVSRSYPPLNIDQQAASRGKGATGAARSPKKWADWDEALAKVDNEAVLDFFKRELAAGTKPYLRRRQLLYRSGSRSRWHVAAKAPHAYVWQVGRFEADEDHWRGLVSQPTEVRPVKQESCLRFKLVTAQDFTNFLESAKKLENGVVWKKSLDDELDADEADDEDSATEA